MPNESTFKGLPDELRFKLVFVGFIGKISYAKVRLFFFSFEWHGNYKLTRPR